MHKINPWLAITVLLIVMVIGFKVAEKQGFDFYPAAAPPSARPQTIAKAAKNVILLIGDGMGFNQVAAGCCYRLGQVQGEPYQSFPVRLAMKTHLAGGDYEPLSIWQSFSRVKEGATDSAAAATAMACGEKTYRYGLGVDCQRRPLPNLVEIAEALGKATGVVTSVPFSHATPAAFVAHNVTRRNYEEIARAMLQSPIDVIMGCGHPGHDDNGRFLEKPDSHRYVGGEELWRQLQLGLAGNDADGDGLADPWTLIESRNLFQALVKGETPKRVLGVPRVSRTLQQKRDSSSAEGDNGSDELPFTTPFITTVPTLAEMAAAALNVLDANRAGFFLMIEGGAIDWAAHANQSGRLIEEQVAFDETVAAVLNWRRNHSSWDETLIIVTADHETGYLSGPGSDPGWEPIANHGAGKLPGLEWHSRQHTNSLVPLLAAGINAESFRDYIVDRDPVRGEYIDNTAIFSLISLAMGNPKAASKSR
ncbi:MAG: alkaline phosphatase [Deltaproteobacteria bacterium]|nr:alkaline phosphatase [Deltaproteobacteria bacterium]